MEEIQHLRNTCVVALEANRALQQALKKFSFSGDTPDRYKILFFVACKLRSLDLERQVVELKVHDDFRFGELFLRVRCLLSKCNNVGILDSEGYLYAPDAYVFDDSFNSEKVVTEDFATKYFAADKLYEIFTELRSKGIRQMDL